VVSRAIEFDVGVETGQHCTLAHDATKPLRAVKRGASRRITKMLDSCDACGPRPSRSLRHRWHADLDEGRAGQALAGALSETFGTSAWCRATPSPERPIPDRLRADGHRRGWSHDRVERQLPEVFARYLARLAAALQPGPSRCSQESPDRILDGLHSRGSPYRVLTGNIYEGAREAAAPPGLTITSVGHSAPTRRPNALWPSHGAAAREALGGDFLGRGL